MSSREETAPRPGKGAERRQVIRDGAEWAWSPHGDTCAFCLVLASRGWERASKKALKGGHAQHIHANCNCEYAIRFDSSTTVAGYDPDKYLEQYEKASGDINAMRRAHYAQHRDKINAQKRAAYAAKHPHKKNKDTHSVRKKTNKSDTGRTESDIIKVQIKLPDIQIGRLVGAKAKNYNIVDPGTGEVFHFSEGSKIQNAQAFAGFGTNTQLHEGVAEGLAEQIGGDPKKWRHCKGNGVIDYHGEERLAEVHWFQEETVGKHKFKIKRWEDES